MRIGVIIIMLSFAVPAWADEKVVQFSTKDWHKAIHRIELDQAELKLLRRQTSDLKQLVTLTTEQFEQCEKLQQSSEQLEKTSDEYRRSLEEENNQLKQTIYSHRWTIGIEAGIIALVALAWALW